MSLEFALALLDGHVNVRCARPETAAWLREALLPAFCDRDGPGDAITVVVGMSAADPAAVSGHGGPLPCFALDREVVYLPGVRVGSDTVVDDEYFTAQYAISSRRVEVRRVGQARLLGASFRVIRELGVAQATTTARCQLHASGVASDGRVVLFAGPKEAGKTTIVAHVAASAGVAIVSNDRALVERTRDGWIAHGVPTIVNVRSATIARLPGLRWPVGTDEQPVMYTLEQLIRTPRTRAVDGPASDVVLSLAQLAHAADAPLAAGGTLACVALVSVDEAVDGFEVRSPATAEAADRLAAVRIGVSTEPRPATVFERALGCEVPPRPAPGLLASLGTEVACFEVRVGSGFLHDSDGPRQLLRQLLEG